MMRTATGQERVKALSAFVDPSLMSHEHLEAEIAALMAADAISSRRWSCSRPGCNGLPHRGWLHNHARASQRRPGGRWATWLIMAGRGWGKTKTGSETVREWIDEADAAGEKLHIAVVARKESLVREICFEHRRSGLLAVIPPEQIVKYEKTVGDLQLHLKGGHVIRGFGAQEPDNLRGWEFDKAWCDEYAAWGLKAQEVMDMLWFCLREALSPEVVITTTPKALPHIKKLVREHRAQVEAAKVTGEPVRVRLTSGHTNDNKANLSDLALEELHNSFDGSRMGRQELSGELLEDVPGALWKSWMLSIEGFRPGRHEIPPLERVVVSVDPAVTSGEKADQTGFCVAGRSYPFDEGHKDRRPLGFVLHSEVGRHTPGAAMRRAAALYHEHKADMVVLEVNNGGEYLGTVLEMVAPEVPYRVVNASRGKRARATPVATLYEQRRIRHVGLAVDFDDLETRMQTYIGMAESKEESPDDLDALVWALWDLFLDGEQVLDDLDTVDERLAGRR